MRSDLENNKMHSTDWRSGTWSLAKKKLTDDYRIIDGTTIVHFLDPNGTLPTVILPPAGEGKIFVIANTGTTDNLPIVSANFDPVTDLRPGDSAFVISDEAGWIALAAGGFIDVFTTTMDGLVPHPGPGSPGMLFLRNDGQWAQVQVSGIVDAFKFITDGTNIAVGNGPDTLRLRSSSGKVTAVVTNNDPTYGDSVNFSVVEAAIDHNALLNYVADQHVAHTSVTLTAGLGLSGGGDISASRTFDFAPSELTVNAAPALTDYAVMDLAAGGPRRTLWSVINSTLVHNNLSGYVANRHIDHSVVTITGSGGLTGGGDITASRVLTLDFNGLGTDVIASGDFFAYYDISGGDHNKITFGTLNTTLDHNALTNYVANQHIDHTAVSILPGIGLSGGGTIAATRTLDLIPPTTTVLGGVKRNTGTGVVSGIDASGNLLYTPAGTGDVVAANKLSEYTANQIVARDNIGAPALGDWAGMSGGSLVASASAGALTVAVKTFSGFDPSATDPVYFFFRDASAGSGAFTRIKVTSALSVVLGSTKTLGAASGQGLRIWISAHNDGGTVKLGAINCTSLSNIFCPQEGAQYTAAVPANLAQVFCTTVAITSAAPWRFIGYCEWSSLTTAGTWTAPNIVQMFGPGIKKPGEVIESRYFTFASQNSTTSSSFTGSSLTDTIVPKSAANIIRTSWSSILVIGNSAEICTAVLYRDGAAQVTSAAQYSTSASGFNYSTAGGMGYDKPNKTTSTVYQVYFHNSSGANAVYFGNTFLSTLELQELMA